MNNTNAINRFIVAYFKPAKTILITGDRGSGKTDISILIAEYLVKSGGWNCYTNIYLEGSPARFEHISTAREMFLNLAESQTNKNIVILDESSIFGSGKRAMSKGNQNLEIFIDLIRKFRACVVFITPEYKNVMPKIRNNYEIWIDKKSHKIAYARLNSDRASPLKINNIPKTSIEFDTYNLAGFEFDIDMSEFTKQLSEFHSSKYREKVIEILTESGSENDDLISDRDFAIECLRRAHICGFPYPVKTVKKSGFVPFSEKHLYTLYNQLMAGGFSE